MRIRDGKIRSRGPGWKNLRIRYNHPGSATVFYPHYWQMPACIWAVLQWEWVRVERRRGGGVPRPGAHSRTHRLRQGREPFHISYPLLRIHDILVWIRIRGSMPLTNGSGCGSGSFYFHHWPLRCHKKINLKSFSAYFSLKVLLRHFTKIKSKKEVTKH